MFSTKTIHLEAVSELTSNAFLAAFSGFVSRRAYPSNVCSDNGKNFVGAAKIIAQDLLKTAKSRTEATWYSIMSCGISFHQERIIWDDSGSPDSKVLSSILKKLSTLLSRIESCLNLRPISPMSENHEAATTLTPGHFLIGTIGDWCQFRMFGLIGQHLKKLLYILFRSRFLSNFPTSYLTYFYLVYSLSTQCFRFSLLANPVGVFCAETIFRNFLQ